MKRYQLLPVVAACMCCMAACSDKVGSKSDNQDAIEITDEDIPDKYKLSNRFSPEQIDSLKKMSRVIYQNLKISDDSTYYILELTEDEAIKAGVTKDFYDDAVESINSTNAAYKQAMADSTISGKLMTPEQLLEAVDNTSL